MVGTIREIFTLRGSLKHSILILWVQVTACVRVFVQGTKKTRHFGKAAL
jgi:hypothetical protein